jgi:hypothetical protein
MSTYRAQPLTCACGTVFTAQAYDSLHVSRRPDLRQQILDGTFHRHACPGCGRSLTIETRLAYSDFPRRQWLTVFPRIDLRHRDELADFAHRSFEATLVARAPELVRARAGELIERVVFGLASLREKLIVLEAGLDDRVVEALKLQLCKTAGLVLHPDTFLHVAAVDAEALVLHYGPPGEAPRPLAIPRELYVALACQSERPRFDEHDVVVDFRALLAPRVALARAAAARS